MPLLLNRDFYSQMYVLPVTFYWVLTIDVTCRCYNTIGNVLYLFVLHSFDFVWQCTK